MVSFPCMDYSYHYPPEIFNLLVDTIPLLCRSKRDVITFFRGAGVNESLLQDLAHRVENDRQGINKYEITRTTLERINQKGDAGLRARREVIKRVVSFDAFLTCWPDDQLKARGLVAELQRTVNVKDSFTRMAQEKDQERKKRLEEKRQELEEKEKHRRKIEKIKNEFYALFAMNDEPQKRGKLLESVLNELFKTYQVLVKDDFRRVGDDGEGVVEQIDGVVELSGHIYLVEMKWVNKPIGVDQISPHLVRIYNRPDSARGIFIASNGYTKPAIAQCKDALSKKTIILISLEELVHLLESDNDFKKMIEQKVRVATIEKNPFAEITYS